MISGARRHGKARWGVAAPHPAATDAAAAVLAEGGSAVDAAIAAAADLTVVYPHNCSVGGDLIALVRAAGAAPQTVFGVGRSASAIDPGAMRARFGDRVPVSGPHSVSVPGVVSGWQAMHELGGRRPMGELLGQAIVPAAGGVAVRRGAGAPPVRRRPAFAGCLLRPALRDRRPAPLGRPRAVGPRRGGARPRVRRGLGGPGRPVSDPTCSPGSDRIRARLDAIDPLGPGSEAGRAGRRDAAGGGRPSGDTVAVVTSDEDGNSVSMLQSVFHSFGSRILDPMTGVLFHNRQSMFTLRPGSHGELQPGLMPPHTLCPAMVDAADGSASVVLSTMGGRGQPQILVQVLLQLAGGSSAADAVSAPRYVVGHSETAGSRHTATAEDDLPGAVVSSLVDGGFDVRIVGPRSEETGHAQLLRVGAAGVLAGAADPRSDGSARRGGSGSS